MTSFIFGVLPAFLIVIANITMFIPHAFKECIDLLVPPMITISSWSAIGSGIVAVAAIMRTHGRLFGLTFAIFGICLGIAYILMGILFPSIDVL